ncbi:MAG: late competence development ComFB family protein [Peptococcaceae bacterium]|nr:late competence development ComFB family protein [Peptococcaceae bacterium]
MIINYTEKEVREAFQRYVKEHGPQCCDCLQCEEDILALTLNQLPPRYVTSHKGEVITDFQFSEPPDNTKVLTALVKSIDVVCRTPSHPMEQA